MLPQQLSNGGALLSQFVENGVSGELASKLSGGRDGSGLSARQQLTRDPAAAMNNAQDGHGVGGLGVPVDDDIRGHDADSDIRPERRTRRTAVRMTGQAVTKLSEQASVFARALR
jgi:hypothetical protein